MDTACREALAEFGEKIMYMTSKNMSKSAPKVDTRFHDGIWLGLRTKSDESIIRTSGGVVKSKTVRRLPEECDGSRRVEHTRRTIKPRVWEEITSPLKSVGQGLSNVEKTSTHQHKSVRSVTLAPQLPHRTRQ